MFKEKIYQKFETSIQKQQRISSSAAQASKEVPPIDDDSMLSLQDIMDQNPQDLTNIYFKINLHQRGVNGNLNFQMNQDNVQNYSYIAVKKKSYMNNGEQKCMIQIRDVTQSVKFEQVYKENQFLSLTNATVSHELRNPIQSLSCQNIKIDLCLKEILKIIKEDKPTSKNEIKSVVKMIQDSYKIQDDSLQMMSFVVDDLLDYAQLNAGKFR